MYIPEITAVDEAEFQLEAIDRERRRAQTTW